MIFTTITEAEFRKFADQSPYKSFMQTPEIAHLREKNGWVPYYFGVKDGNELIAATMAVAKPTFLGKSTFYTPGGPLLDYENTPLVTFFFKNLKNYTRSHNGYILQIDPYYELIQRDRNGDIVTGGYDRRKALKTLKSLGFRPLEHSSQPKYLFVMDINGRTPDEILMDFKRNTRNHVRKAEKMGVTVRELKREELDKLKKITEATSERRHFIDRPLSYYQQMYDLFHDKGGVKFMVAEAEVREDENMISETVRDNGSGMSEEPRNDGTTKREKTQLAESSEQGSSVLRSIDGRDEASRRNRISSSPKVPLSAAMFMTYGDEVIYLFSGSDEKYMRDYNAQYAIQWHMIKYAAEHGYKKYNFYGIQGLPDHNAKDYGIYEFKKGFGGHVVELLGSFELPLSPIFYRLHSLLTKLKHH